METKKHVYVTVNGAEVEYQAISLDALRLSWRGIEKEYRERGEPIDPPTYKWKTASGAEMEDPHDATTDKTPEEQAAWDLYLDTLDKMRREKNFLMMQYIFEDGLSSIQVPEDAAWLEKHERRKIQIPTDPQKLREFYITSEVLPTSVDIAGITTAIKMLSQLGKVDEAALETAQDSFCDYLGRKAAKRTNRSEEQVETQPEVPGN